MLCSCVSCGSSVCAGSLPTASLVPSCRYLVPQEDGWNAIYISEAYNCWVRNIATINADSTVLINGKCPATCQQGLQTVHQTVQPAGSACFCTQHRAAQGCAARAQPAPVAAAVAGASALTVSGIRISASKTRANNIPNKWNERADADGHWGVQHTHSFDVLVTNFVITCSLLHDVGTGSSGKFGVYMNGRMAGEGP